MNKHLIWAITIFSIVLMICGTLLWINHNSWTIRFEMDNNTKEAITSIEWEEISGNQKIMINNTPSFLLEVSPCSNVGAEIYYSYSSSAYVIVTSCKLNNESIIQIENNHYY